MEETLSIELDLIKDLQSKMGENISLMNKSEAEIYKKIDDIDKNLFRLVIILGSAGVGTIFAIIQMFLHK
jgi:hypothetical protein